MKTNKPVSFPHSRPASENTSGNGMTLADRRPEAGTQAMQLKMIQGNSVRVLQRVFTAQNVAVKARQFLYYHTIETNNINYLNGLLSTYSDDPTEANLEKINAQITGVRTRVNECNNRQAALIGEYFATDDQPLRKRFLDAVLEENSDVMRPLFEQLAAQTNDTESQDDTFKHRFLSFTLQSMKYTAGRGRFVELMALLGDRNVTLTAAGGNVPQAGLENAQDDALKEKTDPRDNVADLNLLDDQDNNIWEFVKAKRAMGDQRQENPGRAGIGNVMVIMDRAQLGFPVTLGMTGRKDVRAFSQHTFTAMHHELGHVVNALKGKHGRHGERFTGALSGLTDEEELQNINLDQYSDNRLSREMGLPERISHGSQVGLTAMQPDELTAQDLNTTGLERWNTRTYNMGPSRQAVLQKIRDISHADWNDYTSFWSVPDTVKKIRTATDRLLTGVTGIRKQLDLVQYYAQHAGGGSRHEVTAEFYDLLRDMDVDSIDSLNATRIALNNLEGQHF